MMEKCEWCGRRGDPSTIRRCSRCKAIRYCSRDCQRQHWPRHRNHCRDSSVDPPPQPAPGSGSSAQRVSPGPTAAPGVNPFSSLFDGTFYVGPWQRAISRAEQAFPGHRVTSDLLGNLDASLSEISLPETVVHNAPFLPFPVVQDIPAVVQWDTRVVLVLRLLFPVPSPFRCWVAEDSNGQKAIVVFTTSESPAPYFQYLDLQMGNFVTAKYPRLGLVHGTDEKIIALKENNSVRIFK